MSYSSNNSKRSMANLTVRLLFIVFSILMIVSLFFSYQYSTKAINQEVDRTLKQTSSLIQNLFDYKLTSMQALQNNQTNSSALQKYVETGSYDQINHYFSTMEKADLSASPDFRFITKYNDIFWEDGNSPFFGIVDYHLLQFAQDIAFYNSWHYNVVGTDNGNAHILIRKSPIINSLSGEVIGQLFIGVVLDNNYALVEHLREASNTKDIILTFEGKPVASTIQFDSALYTDLHKVSDLGEKVVNDYLYSKIDLKVSGIQTPLSIYSIQSNQNILSLENNFRLSFSFSAISIIAAALFARFLVEKRVTSELNILMKYAKNAREYKTVVPFEGSEVYEFNHIGMTLEHTFEEIIEKEKSFQDLFQYAVSPIIVWDSSLNINRMNPAAEKAFNQDDSFSIDVFNEFQNEVREHLRVVYSGSILSGVNIKISDTVYRWNISPVILENGVQSVIGQGQDITTLIDAEKQSNLARIEAERLANERADFLARMSHEIRTPLNGILGISLLLKKSVTSPEQKKNVEVLLQSGEHLLAVLNDILDFSKIEQGKFKITHNDFLLSNIIDSVENIYRPLCLDKGIHLKVSGSNDNNPYVHADQVRITQILFNLLSNAVKFTHKGSIKVSIMLSSCKVGLTDLNVVVEDTGIGISKDYLENIFEPFEQSEKTSIREYGGSGLGLAIVKSLIEMMDGNIDIKSKEGYGTSITVNIPVEVVKSSRPQKEEVVIGINEKLFPRALKILIVEDNQTNAYIAQAFCRKYGMEVKWVKDGYEALENLKQNQYDIILMDNQMPNIDGIETTSRIRDMAITTPVIACTADGYEDTREAFMQAGANYVLVKPIREEQFSAALKYYKEHYYDS